MQLIVYYLIFMVVGDIADYGIGLASEQMFGSQVSLVVFLSLYFLSLWLAWVGAVWMTDPKRAKVATG